MKLIHVFALIGALFVAGPAQADDIDDCNGNAPDRAVRGCTRVIADRALPKTALALAYGQRGFAYFNLGHVQAAKADFTAATKQDPRNAPSC